MHVKFETFTGHGEGEREPFGGGTVILSRLGRGASRLRSTSPSVKFVLQGEAVYEIRGRKHRVRAGEFLFVGEGTRFTARVQGTDDRIAMCVYLRSAKQDSLSIENGERLAASILQGFSIDPFAEILRRHATRLASHPHHGQVAASQIIDDVTQGAEIFLTRFSEMERSLRALKRSTRVETLRRLERARAFIHERAGTRLTLDEIADAAHLSRFHLSRTFAQVYGAAPMSYHRFLRLEEAARRLARSECSATQLAYELDYASLSAFSRAFTRRFGTSPSQAEIPPSEWSIDQDRLDYQGDWDAAQEAHALGDHRQAARGVGRLPKRTAGSRLRSRPIILGAGSMAGSSPTKLVG